MSPTDPPSPHDSDWFTDAGALRAPEGTVTAAERVAALRALLKADVSGAQPGAVVRSYKATPRAERDDFRHRLNEALDDDELREWVSSKQSARKRAEQLAVTVAPADRSARHNRDVTPQIDAFGAWSSYPHAVIIVPGYTPLDQAVARPGLHPVAQRRVETAAEDFRAKQAPFVLFTGANVYPRGTPYYEAIEMKKAWAAMGMPAERAIVEARARHSTTNLRNAGRFMLSRDMPRALITTRGGGVAGSEVFDQDFYFSNPTLSTFHARCMSQLGYRVGELRDAGSHHATFVPSPKVRRINWRDVLDP